MKCEYTGCNRDASVIHPIYSSQGRILMFIGRCTDHKELNRSYKYEVKQDIISWSRE